MASTEKNNKTVGFRFVTYETTLVIENAKLMLAANSSTTREVKSNEFTTHYNDMNDWSLEVHLKKSSLNVWLCNRYNHCDVDAEVSLSIFDSEGLKRNTQTLPSHRFLPKQFSHHFNDFITSKYMPKFLEDTKLLPGGDLTLHCEVTAIKRYDGSNKTKNTSSAKFNVPETNKNTDIATLFDNGKLSDVVVAVGEKEIKAHKVILGLQSAVFAAMFESDMVETRENRVIISDLDFEVVQEMVQFIYTGKAPKLSEMADRLLMAADKYSLDALKAMCEQELYKTISVDTVAELLALADRHNAIQLKNETRRFIETNLKEIMTRTPVTKLISDRSFNLLWKEMSKLNFSCE